MAMKGSALLLKKGTSASGTALGGFRTVSFSINSETVDVTTSDNTNRWRELLAAAGVKSMSVTAAGVLEDTATHDQMIDDLIAQTIDAYGITVGSLGTFNGDFQLTQMEGAGEYNGEQTFQITLESAGDITYAAVT